MPFMWALWLCRFAQTSAAVLLAGTAVLRLLARGTRLDPAWPAWRRLAWAAGAALLAAGVLLLGLTAAEMSGLTLVRAITGGALGPVLAGTRFGAVWRVRMGLLGGWFALAAAASGSRRAGRRAGVGLDLGQALFAAALLGSLVWVGHAQASAKSGWLLPVDLLHVLAAGVWPGGLLPLALLLARARRDPTLILAAETITRRFSQASMLAVPLLALSGLLNSCGLVGTPAAVWPTAYGRLLLCKVTLMFGLVGLGAMNRRLVWGSRFGDGGKTVARLWHTLAWECALAICVLLATEALAMRPPPA